MFGAELVGLWLRLWWAEDGSVVMSIMASLWEMGMMRMLRA